MSHKKTEIVQTLLLLLRDYHARASVQLESSGITGIKPKHSSVLMHIGGYGPSRLNDLAKNANIKPQSMTNIIDELVTLGYVERYPDPKDSRAKLINFTKKGETVIHAFSQITETIWQEYADIVGDDEFSNSMDCLSSLTTTLFCKEII